MPETSIVIKADDKYSDAIKKMSSVTKAFNKDQDAMEAKLKELRENQHALQDELKKSADNLKTLQKQYEATGDAAVKSDRDAAQAKYDTIKRNLELVTKGAKEAEKQMQKTGKSFTTSGEQAKKGFGGISGAMQGIGIAMAGQVVSQLIQPGISALVSSAFGSDVGSISSSALSGAISGFAIGSAIPVIGSAVGALIGGGIGAASGWMQVEEKKDDYFKSYYNGIIDEQAQRREAAIQSGSSIAASREKDKISFATLFGDAGKANDYLDDLVGMANTTPFLYDDLTAMSKTLATYGYGADNILPVLQNIGDAGAALGMNTSDMSMVATALGRMKSSDKATLEYLNILNDRGIGAVQMLADAKGLSVGDTYDAISKGKIKGGEAAEIILAALQDAYGGSMVKQSKTFEGLTSTLTGLKQEAESGYGIGYNEEREKGINADIANYGGALGNALKAQNEIEGTLAAHRENLQGQYTREALGAVLMGRSVSDIYDEDAKKQLETMGRQYQVLADEYAKTADPEIGLKMQNLKDQAEALAKEAYDSSEWAKKELSAQEENTKAIRDMTASFDGWKAQYAAEQETTKGRGDAESFREFKPGTESRRMAEGVGSSYSAVGSAGTSMAGSSNYAAGLQVNGSHASGLKRVPFDNYVALLHEGERVLTASEARQTDAGGGVVVNVSGNQFTVRSEADIDAIAQAIAEQIGLARQSGNL